MRITDTTQAWVPLPPRYPATRLKAENDAQHAVRAGSRAFLRATGLFAVAVCGSLFVAGTLVACLFVYTEFFS